SPFPSTPAPVLAARRGVHRRGPARRRSVPRCYDGRVPDGIRRSGSPSGVISSRSSGTSEPPARPRSSPRETMPVMDELVRVYASGDAFAAQLMRGRLEAEDIPVLVKGEAGGPYRMGPCYLWVSQEDATRAKGIVEALAAVRLADSEDTE